MDEEKTAYALLAGGFVGALGATYAIRSLIAARRAPVQSAMTIALPRERVEAFLNDDEDVERAAGSRDRVALLERLEVVEAPGGRGTEIHASSRRAKHKYELKNVLRRMKALLETGETPTNRMAVR